MLATTEKDSSVRTVDRKIFAGRNTVDFGIFANKAKHIIHRNFGNQGTHGNQIISCNVDKHGLIINCPSGFSDPKQKEIVSSYLTLYRRSADRFI